MDATIDDKYIANLLIEFSQREYSESLGFADLISMGRTYPTPTILALGQSSKKVTKNIFCFHFLKRDEEIDLFFLYKEALKGLTLANQEMKEAVSAITIIKMPKTISDKISADIVDEVSIDFKEKNRASIYYTKEREISIAVGVSFPFDKVTRIKELYEIGEKYLEWQTIRKVPFEFGRPVPPSHFFGREEETKKILTLLEQKSKDKFWNIAIIGDRRMGKSSFLKFLEHKLKEKDFIPVYMDIPTIHPNNFYEKIIKKIVESISTKTDDGQRSRKIKALLSERKWGDLSKLGIDINMGFLTIRKPPNDPDYQESFKKTLESLHEKLEETRYRDIVLLLDEIDVIASWEDADNIFWFLRSLFQEIEGYNFIVGSSHPLYQITSDICSPFFNIFYNIYLKEFKNKESRDLLEKLGTEGNIRFLEDAIEKIIQLSGNRPYYIQVLGTCLAEKLIDKHSKEVDQKFVDLCIGETIERLFDHMESRWDQSTEFQRNFLLSLLNNTHKNFLKEFDKLKEMKIAEELKLLEKRRIISKINEDYVFSDLLFPQWIKDNKILNL